MTCTLCGRETPLSSDACLSCGALASSGGAFGARYQILKVLGTGGMGVVYQAWDQVLSVVVALKVIRPETASDPAAVQDIERRFKRELLLARKVTHKHVVRIHDLGEVDGVKYITMSYVEGEDLATILKRDGTLPVARVLRIARQAASGLQAAHEAGVVHRDLKPANIMMDTTGGEENALLMDFGIALSAESGGRRAPVAPVAAPAAPPPIDDGATMLQPGGIAVADATMLATPGGTVLGNAGGIIGTIEYMSPEQSRGDAVDHRSDIYTFGLILTDLLVGARQARPGTTPWDALTERVEQPPVPLSTRHPHVPADFDAVIMKCLQLNPADRFQTTAELVAALDRLDADGNLIPEPEVRRFTPRVIAAAAVVLIALIGGTWWFARGNAPVEHKPVSVLIADFTNSSNDPVFSGLVEQALAVGVEGASFISAFPHRDAMRVVAEIKAGPTLDDATARLVAMREGLNVVIGGAIAARGNEYVVSVKATNVGDQKVVLDWNTTAAGKDQVLAAVGRAAARVRRTLGDTNTANASSEQETFTASSLEAAKAYAEGQELQWSGKSEEAIAAFQRTLQIDPNFSRARAGMAALYANLGRAQEAEANYNAALGQLLGQMDRMTEREKLRTRAGYFLFKRNYDKAIEESEALLKRYPADTAGLANLALAQFYRRDMKTALEVGRRASDVYPNNVIRKNNAALFAMYAGDFDEATRLARKVLELNPSFAKAYVALGMSQLAQGHAAEAAATFGTLSQINTPAAKAFAATSLIDVALYEGREQDALKQLDAAIASDRAAKNLSFLGRRLAIRAGVLVSRGNKTAALRDAREAVTLGKEEGILYTAGRAMIDAGQPAAALELGTDLDNRLENEPRLYGALLKGDVALAAGRVREALTAFQDAQKLGDSWMGRFSLGRAYLALNAFPEASSEFDRCLTRRGEATAVFLDDLASYRVLPPVYYYLGRAQEGMHSPAAAESYKTFLAIKQRGDERGLVADARRRVNQSK